MIAFFILLINIIKAMITNFIKGKAEWEDAEAVTKSVFCFFQAFIGSIVMILKWMYSLFTTFNK